MQTGQDRVKTRGVANKIALGAAGLAVTAGVVAAGAALMKRKNREILGKKAIEATKTIGAILNKRIANSQGAVAHQIQGKNPFKRRSSRGRKASLK